MPGSNFACRALEVVIDRAPAPVLVAAVAVAVVSGGGGGGTGQLASAEITEPSGQLCVAGGGGGSTIGGGGGGDETPNLALAPMNHVLPITS